MDSNDKELTTLVQKAGEGVSLMVKSLDYNQLAPSGIKSQGGFGKFFDDRERVALVGPNQSPQLQRLGRPDEVYAAAR